MGGGRKSQRKSTFGSNRRPGPVGGVEDPFPSRSAGELIIEDFDPEDSDWQQLADASDVFIKRAKPKTQADRTLNLDARIKEDAGLSTRGSTSSKLFLELGIEEPGSGKFTVCVTKAVLKGVISVRTKKSFDKLSDFASLYAEFASKVKSGTRVGALKSFSTKHIKTVDGDPTTDFTGVRAKTVLHEVHHIRHAQEQADAVIDNLMESLASDGKKASGFEPGKRIRSNVEAHFRGWSADPKGAVHRQIVEHDCAFMIALYERNKLNSVEATAAKNPHPDSELQRLSDVIQMIFMDKLGEPYPWNS
jgi:hypothetical protein